MQQPVAVFLTDTLAEDILKLFEEIVSYRNRVPYLLSESSDLIGPFLALDVVSNKGTEKSLHIQIPINHVLAIVEIGEAKHPVGFHPFNAS